MGQIIERNRRAGRRGGCRGGTKLQYFAGSQE